MEAARLMRPLDFAYDDVKRRIMMNELKPGEVLTELDIGFHQMLFALSGLEALEQILTRCMLHAHRWRLWAPSHRRPLMETARRHRPILDKLAAKDGEGLAGVIGHHIDTIVTRSTGPRPRKRSS